MDKIDCFGDICPVPLLKLKGQLNRIEDGDTFMMVVDHSCVVASIQDHYKSTKHDILVDEVFNGVWELTITKNAR